MKFSSGFSISRTALVGLAIANLASGSNFNTKVTANIQADGVHSSREAVYEVNGHKRTIALDSAKELRRVFSLQVNKQKHEFNDYPLLEPAEPRIDSRGIIHMGAWSLTTEDDHLVLAQRAPAPSGGKVFYRLLAQVRLSPEGVWSVEPIAVQRVFR